MSLRWRGHSEILGALFAVGLRGTYVVQSVGREWILQGVGHDGLPMLALPAEEGVRRVAYRAAVRNRARWRAR